MISDPEKDRHHGTLWVQDPSWPIPSRMDPLIPASFLQFTSETASELAEAMGLEDPSEVHHRFHCGRRSYGARVEGKIATYGWVTFDEEKIGELQMNIQLAPGEAYIWDCATLPEFRRRRLYTALLVKIIQELHAEGLQRIWIGTDRENVTSQMGMASAGFKQVADISRSRNGQSRQIWFQGKPGIPKDTIESARRALVSHMPNMARESSFSNDPYHRPVC